MRKLSFNFIYWESRNFQNKTIFFQVRISKFLNSETGKPFGGKKIVNLSWSFYLFVYFLIVQSVSNTKLNKINRWLRFNQAQISQTIPVAQNKQENYSHQYKEIMIFKIKNKIKIYNNFFFFFLSVNWAS